MHADTILSRLGDQMRAARANRGFTQKELADLAGLPRLKVIQVEAGRATVSIEAYAKVAGALGMELTLTPSRRPTLDELKSLDL
jgi:transcriptional regulator with XRE-family HTH domain